MDGVRASRGWLGVLGLGVTALGAACAGIPRTPPTVRYAVQEPCTVCDIEVSARRLAGGQALDCGRAFVGDEAPFAQVQECARGAAAEGRPFLAILLLQGIDSSIIQGLVRAPDGTLSELWYDSDGTGSGMACNARISQRPCRRLMPHPEEPSRLTCERSGPRTTMCREREFTLGPPEDASTLECLWEVSMLSAGAYLCYRVPSGKGNVPPGTALACQPDGDRDFLCSKSAEGDAVLDLRNPPSR
jgi:hypothetical protein